MATIPVAAVSAAAWAALCGIAGIGIVVTIAWVLSSRAGDGLGVPVQSAGLLWLVSHHAGVSSSSATITLLPLALMAVPLALLRISGRWAARITSVEGWTDQALLVVAGTTAYALIAFGVSQFCDLGGAATVSPAMAVGWAGVIGALGLSLGVLSAKGGWRQVWSLTPEHVRPTLVAAAGTSCALIAISAAVGVFSLLINWKAVTGLEHALAGSVIDLVGILFLTLAYLPNLIVWVLAYVSGAGIVIGGGATATVFSISGGLLPSIPVLAAIPSDPGRLAPLLLLLPVAAGVVGALIVHHRYELELRDKVIALVLGCALVAMATLTLTWLSGGSLGAARLAYLGPKPVLTALCVFGLTVAGSVGYALVLEILPTLRARGTSEEATL